MFARINILINDLDVIDSVFKRLLLRVIMHLDVLCICMTFFVISDFSIVIDTVLIKFMIMTNMVKQCCITFSPAESPVAGFTGKGVNRIM